MENGNGTVVQAETTQQQQAMGQEASQQLEAILGGMNGGASTPALDELKSLQSQAAQPQQPAQQPVANPLVDSQFNTQGPPDVNLQAQPQEGLTFAQQQQEIERLRAVEQSHLQQQAPEQTPGQVPNNNELVNLTGDETGAGPTNEPAAEPAAASTESEFLVDNPLLQIKNETQPGAEVPNPLANFQGIDQINEYLASKIPGMENLDSLISGYSDLNKSTEGLNGVQSQYDNLIGGLKNLHPDLIEAMRLNEAGEDFRGYLSSKPSIDYTASEKDQDVKGLVKAYFPDKVSDADYEAADSKSEDYDANTERYVRGLEERALERFGREKGQYTSKVNAYVAEKEGQRSEYQASVRSSLESVKGIFPGVQESYMNSIEDKIMKNGIDSLFYDGKGNLKADAAARFVMASDDGKNLLTTLQDIAQKKAKTAANLDIITRSQRTAPEQGGVGMMQDVNEGRVDEHIKSLIGGVNAGQTY